MEAHWPENQKTRFQLWELKVTLYLQSSSMKSGIRAKAEWQMELPGALYLGGL